ncbi:hypothetical protein RclHR1_00790048 [Rhizophagus clarus]|uniref:Hsp20/alpha crystallin family protein n=1 Tax=Rhizophagus clarus TaxID=94130 RepID=A0A2Z6RYB7_9GLOM|nr:hypothetical protein RclHR1_00790048 [Rhizophagus clarus]GES90703.1 Hsp20/alpha crystallin family protein [Rhizophagus clarus]
MLIFDDIFDITTSRIYPTLSGSTFSSNPLLLNISSTSTHYIVRVELPGIPQSQISVDINDDGLLDIRAERHSKVDKEKIKDEGEDEIIKEKWILKGKLQRSVKFPKDCIDVNGVKAELDNGELIIKVPKKKSDEKDPKKKNIKIIKGKL